MNMPATIKHEYLHTKHTNSLCDKASKTKNVISLNFIGLQSSFELIVRVSVFVCGSVVAGDDIMAITNCAHLANLNL